MHAMADVAPLHLDEARSVHTDREPPRTPRRDVSRRYARRPRGARLPLLWALAVSLLPGQGLAGVEAVPERVYHRALADWEHTMRERGRQLGQKFVSTPVERLNADPPAWYYDSERVFLRIADRLGDPDGEWHRFAQAAERAYKAYIRPRYAMPGYQRFPHGLALDHARSGDADSKAALLALRDHGPFADVLTNAWSEGWHDQRYSREIAYMIQTHVQAERVGADRQPAALAAYVERALAHVEAWTHERYRSEDPRWGFCQGFMAGLTASALIEYVELERATGGDAPEAILALHRLGDWLIETMWVPGHAIEGTYDYVPSHYGAFRYVRPAVEGVGGTTPAPDLNLLIAPLYGWLYLETGESRYRDIGDMAFAGGVALAYIAPDKNFNQNYRSSFDYVDWRARGIERWHD